MPYELLADHMYILMFLGILFGGETVLLPAIYFGIIGKISLTTVIMISVTATVISDTAWYFLGMVTAGKFSYFSKFIEYYRNQISLVAKAFRENSLVLLFVSKFVYGARTATQITCGVQKVPFVKYFFVNIFGILSLNALFVILGVTIQRSLNVFVESPIRLWFSLALFAAVVIIIHRLSKTYIWNKLSPS